MRHRRSGGSGAEAPSRNGGEGALLGGAVVLGGPGLAAQQQRQGAPGLRGELQPARGGERHPNRDLGHHPGQPGMAQPFLHRQQSLMPPGLGVDHPGGVQAGGGKCGGEEIRPFEHPQYRAGMAGEDPGGEQGGRGSELRVDAVAGEFMESGEGKATAGQGGVDAGMTEGKRAGIRGWPGTLDPRDGGAKLFEVGGAAHVPNLFQHLPSVNARMDDEAAITRRSLNNTHIMQDK